MRTVFLQWKEIAGHRALLLSVIGLMFVPLIYGGLFLSAFWDPYGHSNQLSIAVVNEDQKTQLSGHTIDLGKSLTQHLKTNKTFHWVFVNNAKQAIEQLQQEDYYMVLIIPSDFSRNATSFLRATPKQVQLRYYTNSGESYTAAQMVKGIIPSVDRNIARAVTQNYARMMFAFLDSVNQKWTKQTTQLMKSAKKIKPLVKGSKEMNQGLKEFAASSLQFQKGLHQARNGSMQLDAGMHTLHAGLSTLTIKLDDLDEGQNKLTTGIAATAAASKKLHQQMAAFNRAEIQFNAQFAMLVNYLKQQDFSSETLSTHQLIDWLNTWKSAYVQADQPVPDVLTSWINQLQNSSKPSYSLAELMQEMHQGSSQMIAGSQALTLATGKISTAMEQINTGTNAIGKGITGIKNGSHLLYTGAGKIMDGNDQLSHGLGVLDNEQDKLSDGAHTLYSGSSQINDGIKQINNQINRFTGNVQGKSQKPLAFARHGEKQARWLAQPESAQVKDLNQVSNYGEGLSPYILSLGLFVGALAFTTFFPMRRMDVTPSSGWAWFISKFSVAAAVALFQAVLICTLMLTIVGLKVTSIGDFYWFTIVSNLAFFAIAQFLATAFNNTGRAIGGVLLLLQFGGSSGIFPVSLTPAFFQWIHDLLPMSYSVNGLRQIISIGKDPLYLAQQTLILSGMGILAMLLTWLVFTRLLHRQNVEEQRVIPASN